MENRSPAGDAAPPPAERPAPGLPATFFSLDELLLLPNVMSFLRLPLAAVFPFAATKGSALTVLALAGLTDVLDGFLARERGEVTATGAILDPIADKAFALSVVGTLVAQGKIPRWGIPALLAREILEAPLLLWVLVRSTGATGQPHEPLAERASNVPGKAATVAQFAAVMAALELPAALPLALGVAAAAGTAAGIVYWRRELDRPR